MKIYYEKPKCTRVVQNLTLKYMHTYEHIIIPYFMDTEYGIDHMVAHSHDTSWFHKMWNRSLHVYFISISFIFFYDNILALLIYRTSRPIRRTFFPNKCDVNSTCILCAEGKCYVQTYKYPYIYYTTSLLWESASISWDLASLLVNGLLSYLGIYANVYIASRDSGYLRCCSSKV